MIEAEGSSPVGNRLRSVRADRRVTQLDLALDCAMSPSRIWRIENGYYTPSDAERDTIARVLGVLPTEIWPRAQQGCLGGPPPV